MLRPFFQKNKLLQSIKSDFLFFFLEIELKKAQEVVMSENLIKNHSRSVSKKQPEVDKILKKNCASMKSASLHRTFQIEVHCRQASKHCSERTETSY